MKKVVIAGGNSGIAQGIAIALRAEMYTVYTPGRTELDVGNYKMISDYMKIVEPDILINSAGYIVPNKIKDISMEEWNEHMAINLTGAFYCAKLALNNGCKTIINIGSTSAFSGRANWCAYCAAKAGILSLTESLAEEGINAYSLNPARTKTKMRKNLFPNEDITTLMKPERVGKFILCILNGEFKSGSHLIVKKDYFYVLPNRGRI